MATKPELMRGVKSIKKEIKTKRNKNWYSDIAVKHRPVCGTTLPFLRCTDMFLRDTESVWVYIQSGRLCGQDAGV